MAAPAVSGGDDQAASEPVSAERKEDGKRADELVRAEIEEREEGREIEKEKEREKERERGKEEEGKEMKEEEEEEKEQRKEVIKKWKRRVLNGTQTQLEFSESQNRVALEAKGGAEEEEEEEKEESEEDDEIRRQAKRKNEVPGKKRSEHQVHGPKTAINNQNRTQSFSIPLSLSASLPPPSVSSFPLPSASSPPPSVSSFPPTASPPIDSSVSLIAFSRSFAQPLSPPRHLRLERTEIITQFSTPSSSFSSSSSSSSCSFASFSSAFSFAF